MIYLYKDITNEAVYTASEFGGTAATQYKLEIENLQSLETNTFTIDDISTSKERYNLSEIVVVDSVTDWTIDSEVLIEADTTVVVRGNVTVAEAGLLEVEGNLIMTGTMGGSGEVTTGPFGLIEESCTIDANNQVSGHFEDDTLIIVDFNSGFYKYRILSTDDEQLEIGKLLIAEDANSVTTYNPENNTYVYNPNN